MPPATAASTPRRPMPPLVTTFSPHVRLNSSPDRFTAAPTLSRSTTRIGRTRNVTSDHASPMSPTTIRPTMPARCSTARSTSDTVALEQRPGQQHTGPLAGALQRAAERRVAAAEAFVGAADDRGVEEDHGVGDREVAGEPEDPGDGVRGPAVTSRGAAVHRHDRQDERGRDDEPGRERQDGQHRQFLVLAQHCPRGLGQGDRTLERTHEWPFLLGAVLTASVQGKRTVRIRRIGRAT